MDLDVALGAACAALGTGLASAWIPVVNAEAALVAAGLAMPASTALLVALAMAVGQTGGKVALFEVARRGAHRYSGRLRGGSGGLRQRMVDQMRGRRRTNAVVLLSAGVGVPPLAVVSLVAGGLAGRRSDFALCCLLGRAGRFAAVVLALLWAK